MTRQEQKEMRREQIRMKALELFVTKGFSETKISDIAGELKISVGLLFHYYESKEQLLMELVQFGVEGTKAAEQVPKDDPAGYFRMFLTGLFQSAKENPWIYQMFVLMSQARSPGAPEAIRKVALSVDQIEKSVPVIQKGQELGQFRDGDPLVLSNAFWCSVQGIMEQHLISPDIPLPDPAWVVDILRKHEN
ncbi:MAG: TetR/AcrR family transcriptional regulator [Lachnospiraceae bacterium]|nr:TetR/AcrR family transcriptional regulator [Lachnospiraceae bacterium]